MTASDNEYSNDPRHPSTSKRGRAQRTRGRNRVRTRIILILVGLAILSTGGLVILAQQAFAVRQDLQSVMAQIPILRSELGDGNYDGATATLQTVRNHTAAARETTSGPLWKAASFVPWAGPNLRAVAEVSVSADDIASRALAPLISQYESLDWQKLTPANGSIDVAELRGAAPGISTAANTVRLSNERLSSIDLTGLIPEVADPIRSTTDQLNALSSALESASSAAKLLPAMLGADEGRNYLLLVQNSAESRATGGIPGALAVLSADDGKLSMRDQSSASALGAFKPALSVDPEQERLYTARLGTQMQNVNLTPHFPTAAETAKNMWEERHPEQTINGVLALDPIVLAHLLEATGPVDLTAPDVVRLVGGTSLPVSLTKDNVVGTLLSDVYREIEDPAAQDAYFAAVASRVFSAFTEGQGDSSGLVRALTQSVQEHRLRLWSSSKDEQDIISSTPLAGSVVGPSAGGAAFGAYFNDGTGAKMDFYAHRTAQLIKSCPSDGYSRYTVQLTVSNSAPQDAATSLPSYVTGGGVYGVEPGHIRTNYVAYGPAQALVETARINGEAAPVGAGKHGQRPVGTVTLELAPGETKVIEIEFSRVVQDADPRLEVTPTVQSISDVVLAPKLDNSCG